jgi:hypothetical protein
MVEVFFGIFTRKALNGASFSSTDELGKGIDDYMDVYNENPKPIVWKKREVKGCQLKNSIKNLEN